jgi:carbamoyl-phosphate synthase large subunit
VLIDRFLEDAFEFDVDAVADATGAVVIGGIMEHIEEAGIHSGDSSCVVPPFMVAERHLGHDPRLHAPHRPRAQGRRPDEHPVRDQGRHVYVLEVNPRRRAPCRTSRRRPACRWRRWRRA